MLVSILGSPCSGKTTTAGMVFADLKKSHIPCEFILEQARIFIASARVQQGLSPTDPLQLSDEDQLKIMKAQIRAEETMRAACGKDVVVVTDSSPLNTLFYMSDELVKSQEVQDLVKRTLTNVDMVFYACPLEDFAAFDPNRIHSAEASRRVDESIKSFIREQDLKISGVLAGSPEARAGTVSRFVLERILRS